MNTLFDFLARFGEVTVGIIAFVCVMLFLIVLIIELVDFLIVDPIKRSQNPPASTDEVLFTSKED